MDRNKRRIIQLTILLAGAVMIVYGVCRGETSVVLNKAVNVCLECIGLG